MLYHSLIDSLVLMQDGIIVFYYYIGLIKELLKVLIRLLAYCVLFKIPVFKDIPWQHTGLRRHALRAVPVSCIVTEPILAKEEQEFLVEVAPAREAITVLILNLRISYKA